MHRISALIIANEIAKAKREIETLRKRHGTGSVAAVAAGVSERTWRYWVAATGADGGAVGYPKGRPRKPAKVAQK